MAAADHTFTQKTQESLFKGSQLLKLGTLAVAGLLSTQVGTQSVLAQAEAIELPQAAPEIPVAQPPAPVAPTVPEPVVPPAVIAPEPIAPTPIVPSSIEATSAEPVDYGTVFIEPAAQQPAPTVESLLEGAQPAIETTPSVDVVSPADYGTTLVDKTDYSVGATMPNVVISERASGCEFSLQAGAQLTNAGCGQTSGLAAAGGSPIASQSGETAAASFYRSGAQAVTGMTTTASREFYNQAAQAVVKLQLGEKFIFPLTIPASLSSLFGWRMHPIFGAQRFHSGSDVAAPLGTPVVATQAGQVTLSDFAGGYGLMVVLRHHNNTLESRYAHLSRLLVQAGEWVEQGEVIGLVGSTGNSTGPHLHFELRQLTENGWTVLNPDSLLRQTLNTLAQALGNSLMAFADRPDTADTAKTSETATPSVQGIPFRPAQPQAN